MFSITINSHCLYKGRWGLSAVDSKRCKSNLVLGSVRINDGGILP